MRGENVRTRRRWLFVLFMGVAWMWADSLGSAGPGAVQAWLTTANELKLLAREPDLAWGPVPEGDLVITVDPSMRYQEIDGFGAAVTGSSAYLLQRLPADRRAELLAELFGSDGLGLSVIRHTMGASDFSLSNYTYDDTPQNQPDYELRYFSLGPDLDHVIPTLQEIVRINPEIKVLGSPWSAPAWMKEVPTLNGSRLRREERIYATYAQYFVRYVEAMAAHGIPVWAVTVQNEPLHASPTYPTMIMAASEQRDFIKNHLGPAFAERNIGTLIIAYDHNWDRTDYALTVLNDPEAARYVAGTAWHCYAGEPSAMSQVHEARPDKGIYFTECSGGRWSTSFRQNLRWNFSNLIIGATRNWARTVLLWNLALDPSDGPTNGGCLNCRGVITIDPETGRIERNVEYYVLGHASKFVRPGAVRIGSDTYPGRLESVAFQNPDGSIALIVLNGLDRAQTFVLRFGDRGLAYRLPAGSVVTLVWAAEDPV